MKLLQILVWILLFVASYDFVRYFLIQTSEAEPAVGEEAVREGHTIFGYDGSELEPLLQWWVGGACLVVLYLARALFRRLLPFTSSVSRTKIEPTQVKKRESFLTCRISDTTINTYTDDQNFDIPGQLSPAQLQVLLEELKFSVDEKFEEIDSWIATNGQELKLWSKRLERVETELSYIRHQIFILMSNNAKVRPNLCVGDAPDTRNHVETLRDLSTILAQVKQQFHENESKGIKVRDCGDHRENYLLVNTEPLVLHEVNEGNERNFIELKNVEAEQKFMILKELKATQGKKKAQDLLPEAKKNCVKEETVLVQHNYLNKSESLESLSSERYESNSTTQSEKDDFISIYENDQNANEKWDAPDRTEIKNLESPRNENGPDRRSRSPSPKSPRIDIADRPRSPNKCDNSSDHKSKGFQENSPPLVAEEESSPPTDLIYNSDPPTQPDTQNKISKPSTKETSPRSPSTKETSPRSPSPRRTVRFAQEKRDVSPSKTPTWLGIKRDSLQVKSNEIKGSSDSKVGSSTYNEAIRTNRDSASCPVVEDKRQSRRSIMEKELTNLERRVSPSPTRNRQNKRPSVRSKVGDYIRGAKY